VHYELYYWPGIQGRGEFVRLALEAADADYLDVARQSGRGKGVDAMLSLMNDGKLAQPPFAPPFLKAGKLVISHSANILQYLGPRLGLAPRAEASRIWAHGLQLSVTDFVSEVHDTHHPIAVALYYREQKVEAKRRTQYFLRDRLPKRFDYFEGVCRESRPDGGARTVLRGPVHVPAGRGSALRVPEGDEEVGAALAELGRLAR
jgi:glutathione S-transferase